MIPLFNRAKIALDKINQITALQAFNDIDNMNQTALNTTFNLQLKNVRYQYPAIDDDSIPFQVGPVDLSLKSGEVVFMIGGNGSGKSTLLKLICGLYAPTEGTMLLDGFSIEDENYRDQFSAIFSDYHLMRFVIDKHGEGVDLQQAKHHLERFYLIDKVKLEKGRLSDIRLSQGQKKRLALLISLFENKSVIIFDEFAADQDPYFKDMFYSDILPELRAMGKLVIVVSHDEKYFENADRIFKLTNGILTEMIKNEVDYTDIKNQFKKNYC
jgi:ABC-type siderophore export system fused ATPase/permease subunit